MADNVVLNPGVGGDVAKSYQLTTGVEVFPGVLELITGGSPGAYTSAYVSTSNPVPTRLVANTPETAVYTRFIPNEEIFLGNGSITDAVCLQPDHAKHHVTAHQDAPWTMQLASGTEVDLASGAEVIAKQDAPYAVTQSGAWSFTQAAPTPAGANLIGKTVASPDSNFVYVDGVPVPVKYAKVDASASGATQVVPAVAGKRIRPIQAHLSSNGSVAIKWQSGTTDLTGPAFMTQYLQTGRAYSPVGHFQTAVNEALNINLSAAVAVGGNLAYIEV